MIKLKFHSILPFPSTPEPHPSLLAFPSFDMLTVPPPPPYPSRPLIPSPYPRRALGGRYRLCMDLVESEEVFRPALSYALGSALVCDTLEEAQELCFTKGEKVRAHSTSLHCTVLYCTTLHCTALHCTVLYCTVLYCTVLYCTVLYCTVLYGSQVLYNSFTKLYCISLIGVGFYVHNL